MQLEAKIIGYSIGISMAGAVIVFVVKVVDHIVKWTDYKINEFIEAVPFLDKALDIITMILGVG